MNDSIIIYIGNYSNIGNNSIPPVIGPIMPVWIPILGGMPIWNSPVLAAALSAVAVFIITFYFNRKDNRTTIKRRQEQAYSDLKGRNAVMAEFCESYAIAFITFSVQRAIRARTGLPFEQLIIDDNERWMKRTDEYSKDVDIEYGKLLTTLSAISRIFSDKGQLIYNVESLNREFFRTTVPDLANSYISRVPIEVALLSPPIPPLGIPIGSILSAEDTQRYLNMENSLLSRAKEEIRGEIERHIREPVEELLESMDREMKKKWWEFWTLEEQRVTIRADEAGAYYEYH